ncbi:pro-MCH [Stegastes partitus]|uniref:Pro-MCH 2-like n=1 Tax=Stegastes partitus TaxID=144197 RepID=A0A3B4ZBN4_9TELE|nr:PREDICTED: pro-MCH 2-like [Stegastes partitus]
MISVHSVLFTLVLFSELSSNVVAVAMPAEDGETEHEGLNSIFGDEPMVEPAAVPLVYRRNLVLDNDVRDEDGSPKVIVISDMRLKGHNVRGLNPAFTRSLSHTPAEYSSKIDRRETDLDVLRCMIGRVYRPCWEA